MNPEVIITNLKKRYSGVSGTINALLPAQSKTLKIAFVGTDLPGAQRAKRENPENFSYLTLWQAIWISRNHLPDGRCRIWHVRRDPEMLLAIFLRDLLRLPIKIVFTSAAQRRHSFFPRWMISRMDCVIATTPEAATYVKASAVIPHGVDVDYFRPPADKLNAWKNTGLPGKYGIGVFGRIRPEKGTDIFVDAMIQVLPEFPEFTAVIAGLCQPQFEAFKAELERKIKIAGLSDRILFIGDIPPQHVRDWYANCLITVACPIYEGYGMTLLEGMASGCSVVGTDTGAFRSFIENGINGFLVPVNDSKPLQQAFIQVMDVAKTIAMGERGRERSVNMFSVAEESQNIAKVYLSTAIPL
jgi:mannosyltransferase